MRKNIGRRQDAHRGVLAVCNANRTVVEASEGCKAMVAALGASVEAVDRLFNEQGAALRDRRNETENCRRARQTIRDIVGTIVDLSRVVVLDPSTAMVMRMPEISSDEQLVMEAGAILDTAAAHADAFQKAGLPDNDLAILRAQIEALKAARIAARSARKAFTVAAKGVRAALKSGDDAIVVVDAILGRSPNAGQVQALLRSAKVVGPSHAGETPAPAAHPEPAPAPEPTTPTKAA